MSFLQPVFWRATHKLIHWVFVSVLLCLAKLHAGALLALEMALERITGADS